jgi:hypothetical protein
MPKKKVTQAVINANRVNANKSTGARSPAGKLAAKRNPRTHGFFAQELIISEAEKPVFQSLSRTLHEELLPKTALQNIAFEEIVSCTWRLKLSVRLEMRRAGTFLDTSDGRETQTRIPEGTPVISSWCLAGRQELRDGIRFLEFIIGDFENNGQVREEWKEPLDRAFGVGFFEELTKWTHMSRDAILLADHLVRHAKTFGKPLPPIDGKQAAELVVDPAQGYQMVGKLLNRELEHLRGLSASWTQRTSQTIDAHNAVVDFAPRYYTTASRDLHRAVDWYVHLKEENL